jgi:hypothetical protein
MDPELLELGQVKRFLKILNVGCIETKVFLNVIKEITLQVITT